MGRHKPVGWRGQRKRHSDAAKEGWITRKREIVAKRRVVYALKERGYDSSIDPNTKMVVTKTTKKAEKFYEETEPIIRQVILSVDRMDPYQIEREYEKMKRTTYRK